MKRWRDAVAEGLAEAWEGAGVRYAVTNGLEDYPEKVGRDLDVVVAPEQLRQAVDVTLEYCARQGWTAVVNRLGWVYWVMISGKTDEGVKSIQVDLFDHLQWEFCWVLDGDHLEARQRHGAFWVDPWSHMAKRLLIHLLSTGGRIFQTKPHYLHAGEAELAALAEGLERITGRRWLELVEAVSRRDAAAVTAMAGDLRQAVRRRSFRAPGLGRRVWSAWQKQWAVNLRPRRGAPAIALHGREGGQADGIFTAFEAEFRRAYVYCGMSVVDGCGVTSFARAWRQELRVLRRNSALQVAHLLRRQPLGRAIFSGGPIPGWLKRIPRADLEVVLAENEEDARAAEIFREAGLVDLVLRATADAEADAAAVMTAVNAWHAEKAARNALMWRRGRL
jgi:hypothetical protein